MIVHQDKEYLKSIVPVLKKYLQNELFLELHSKKIYLQHFFKGVNFLGTVIKPYRIYIGNRTKGSFYKKIEHWNNFFEKERNLTKEDFRKFLASMNSYLGIIGQYNTYKLRQKMLIQNLPAYFWNHIYISNNYSKLALRVRKV